MRHFLNRSVLLGTALLGGALAFASAADAATFRILEAGTTSLLGIFEAPALGGALTSISATIGGVTYDTLAGGIFAPTYDAAANDLAGSGGSLGYASNSAAAGVCGAGDCAFSFYPIFDFVTPIPGEWYTDIVSGPGSPDSLDFGYYEIAPIPAPLGALLLASGLLGLAGLRNRKPV